MRDTTLETQLRLLVLQTESWKQLHDFITYALDKSKPIVSAEQEIGHVFKELNLVAELSGKAMNVLQRASSIRGVRELSVEETRRLESDWNAVFTKVGVVQGQLKARRRELLRRSLLRQTFVRIFGRKTIAR